MNNFKVGDRVQRIRNHYGGMCPGFMGTVIEVGKEGIRIKEYEVGSEIWHDIRNFVLEVRKSEVGVYGICFFMNSINKK